jgi:hypothetical protein
MDLWNFDPFGMERIHRGVEESGMVLVLNHGRHGWLGSLSDEYGERCLSGQPFGNVADSGDVICSRDLRLLLRKELRMRRLEQSQNKFTARLPQIMQTLFKS